MTKLYLAKFELVTRIRKDWYAGSEEVTRLVYADSIDEVQSKLDKHYEIVSKNAPYSQSYQVENLIATEAIM